jgi:hypothetical protein
MVTLSPEQLVVLQDKLAASGFLRIVIERQDFNGTLHVMLNGRRWRIQPDGAVEYVLGIPGLS